MVCKIGVEQTIRELSGSSKIRYCYTYGMGVIQQIIVDDMIPQTRVVFALDASDISCSKSPELGSKIPNFFH